MSKTKKRKKNIIEFLIISAVIILLEGIVFCFFSMDFRLPNTYQGGDGLAELANIRKIVYGDADRLGWPYHENVSKYSPVYNLPYVGFIKIASLFTKDVFLLQNLVTFLIPYLNVILCFYVFKYLKVNRVIALLGAIAFGFCPYVQARLFHHPALATVEFIPVVLLLCIWIYEDENFCKINKQYFKDKRHIFTLVIAFFIANNGMVYYPFYSCFLLVVTGLAASINTQNIKRIFSSLTVCVQIGFFLALGFLPTLIGMMQGLGNVATQNAAYRDARRAAFYGLDIKAMFLSPHGYGIKPLVSKYEYLFDYTAETGYAYIGILGILGFVVAMIFLVKSPKQENKNQVRIRLMSILIVAILLLGVSKGFGVIVALVIPMLSCYDRINPFFVAACIFSLTLLIEELTARQRKNKLVLYTVSVIVAALATAEMSWCYFYTNKAAMYKTKEQVASENAFFQNVETVAGEDGMIFMLPYMQSFENGWVYDIQDYDHLRAYLATENLRFSYGGTNQEKNDDWYAEVSDMDLPDMISELRSHKFSGIYINLKGYAQEDHSWILDYFENYFDKEDAVSDSEGKLWYFSLVD
ncbi:MAG: hypothetical protein MJ105_03290 [Lachnospiraceae bacterium]|nr:hypothetical protein [Lachnospiraceae bacterium]